MPARKPEGKKIGPAPAKKIRIVNALLKNPFRTNPEIAKLTNTGVTTVLQERHRLEKLGKIKRFRQAEHRLSYPALRKIVRELHKDYKRTNQKIAQIAGVSPPVVGKIRRALEKKGRIPFFDGRKYKKKKARQRKPR